MPPRGRRSKSVETGPMDSFVRKEGPSSEFLAAAKMEPPPTPTDRQVEKSPEGLAASLTQQLSQVLDEMPAAERSDLLAATLGGQPPSKSNADSTELAEEETAKEAQPAEETEPPAADAEPAAPAKTAGKRSRKGRVSEEAEPAAKASKRRKRTQVEEPPADDVEMPGADDTAADAAAEETAELPAEETDLIRAGAAADPPAEETAGLPADETAEPPAAETAATPKAAPEAPVAVEVADGVGAPTAVAMEGKAAPAVPAVEGKAALPKLSLTSAFFAKAAAAAKAAAKAAGKAKVAAKTGAKAAPKAAPKTAAKTNAKAAPASKAASPATATPAAKAASAAAPAPAAPAVPPVPSGEVVDGLVVETQRPRKYNCNRCKAEVDPLRCIVKSKSSQVFYCHGCNNTCCMLSRKMNWPPVEFTQLPDADQEKFFQDAAKLQADGGRLSYGKLRGSLKGTFVTTTIRQSAAHVNTEDLPMSVWISRGWEESHIRRTCIKKDDAIHGEVWAVPVRSSKETAITQQIESMIATWEKQMRKKSLEADATDEQKAEHAALQIESESSDSSSSKKKKKKKDKKRSRSPKGETEAQKKRRLDKESRDAEKAAKAAKDKAAAEAAAAAKKAAEEVTKFNNKQSVLANITIAALQGIMDEAKKLLKDSPACDHMPDYLLKDITTGLKACQDKYDESEAVLKNATRSTKKGEKNYELAFDKAQVTKAKGDLQTNLQKFKKVLAALK